MIDITLMFYITTILALIIALISMSYVMKLRHKISDINMVNDLIKFQNDKIAEIALKVDLLSKKLSQDENVKHISSDVPIVDSAIKNIVNHVVAEKNAENFESTDLENAITSVLVDRELSSSEIQKLVGRTREHVSRTLKKMVEEGKLKRDESHKPYKYKLIQGVNQEGN